MYPRVHQSSLPRVDSDHVHLCLEAGSFQIKARPFRFEHVWFVVEGLVDLISGWWNELNPSGCGSFVLAKELSFLKSKLKDWSRNSFGSHKIHKLELLHYLHVLDQAMDSRALFPEEMLKEVNLLSDLNSLLKQEEIFWK